MMFRAEAINLLDLRFQSGTDEWNRFLTRCRNSHDLQTLGDVYRRVNMGMADLAKGKLNTDEMTGWYLRLQKSLENTCLEILRLKKPGVPVKQVRVEWEAILKAWRY